MKASMPTRWRTSVSNDNCRCQPVAKMTVRTISTIAKGTNRRSRAGPTIVGLGTATSRAFRVMAGGEARTAGIEWAEYRSRADIYLNGPAADALSPAFEKPAELPERR